MWSSRSLIPFVGLFLVVACDDKPALTGAATASAEPSATAAPTADVTPTGIQACDDYIAKAAACMAKLTGNAKDTLRISIGQHRNQVAQAKTDDAKEVVAIGCEAELDALADDPDCK